MSETSDEFIRSLEDAARLPEGTLGEMLGPFSGQSMSDVPDEAEEAIRHAFLNALRQNLGRADFEHSLDAAQQVGLTGSLKLTKLVVLSMPDSVVTASMKDFIDKHCPC